MILLSVIQISGGHMLIMKKYDNLLSQKLYSVHKFWTGKLRSLTIGSSLFSLEFSNRNYVLEPILPNFFFIVNKEFFHFSLLSLAIVQYTLFSYATNSKAYQQKLANRKNESLVGLTPDLQLNYFLHNRSLIF